LNFDVSEVYDVDMAETKYGGPKFHINFESTVANLQQIIVLLS